jgi:protein disulfide-isomerase A1
MLRTIVACSLLAVVGAADVELDEGVLVGTDDNFDSIVTDNTYVLAEFYAPWCGHCKQLAPEYAKAATTLAESGSEIKLVKVDATEYEDLAGKFNVEGFPTLKWFKNGKDTEFSGGRTADEIVQWVTKKSGPPAVPCTTYEECEKLREESAITVFGFFEDLESAEAKVFLEVADASDFTFVHATEEMIATRYDMVRPMVVVFTDFDEGKFFYSGDWSAESLSTFVLGSSLPLVIEFTEEAAPKIFGGEVKSHFILFGKFGDEEGAEELKDMFSNAARPYKGKVLFITMDVEKEENERIMEFFGITAEDTPTYRIINVEEEMAKFAPPLLDDGKPDMTSAGMMDFVQGYVDGTLKRHLNTEEVPEDWDAKPVKVLTGKNFDEVALDESKHALVEFYAPWCGHCKQLAPIYDELGAAFEGVDNVVIAKMDSTTNEVEAVSVESFPTLKFFPAGAGAEVEDYDGERTLAAMTEFLNEKVGTKVEVKADPEGATGDGAGAGHSEL